LQQFHPLDEIAKIGNHFGRAAGKIDNRYISFGQPLNDAIDRFARHDFFALRPGVYVTMCAGEVAKFSHVYLQNFRPCPAQF
jgi:hypothetical protein